MKFTLAIIVLTGAGRFNVNSFNTTLSGKGRSWQPAYVRNPSLGRGRGVSHLAAILASLMKEIIGFVAFFQ